MKKTMGITYVLIGLTGTIIFSIKAAQNSENFSFLGLNFAVSQANLTPVILSIALLVLGAVLLMFQAKEG